MFKDIILAEDDEDDRLLFMDAMSDISADIPVQVAINGEELMGMLKARETSPEMIFLDLNMPVKNGFQCLEEIKADDKLKDCTVVILTTSRNPADVNRAYNLGATLFVTKPVDFRALQSTLKNIITAGSPGDLKTLELA